MVLLISSLFILALRYIWPLESVSLKASNIYNVSIKSEPESVTFDKDSPIQEIKLSRKFEWSGEQISFSIKTKNIINEKLRVNLIEEDQDTWGFVIPVNTTRYYKEIIEIPLSKFKLQSNLSKGDGEKLQYILRCVLELAKLSEKPLVEITIENIKIRDPLMDYSQEQTPFYPERYMEYIDEFYALKPNFFQLFDGNLYRFRHVTEIRTNNDGLRDKEYTIKKPLNITRILAFGDSFTFGYGVNSKDTWVKKLEEKLNDNGKFEVINFGVPGYNLQRDIRLLELKGIKYSPDVVILGFLEGDLDNLTRLQQIIKELYQSTGEPNGNILRKAAKIFEEENKKLSVEEKKHLLVENLYRLKRVTNSTKVVIFSFWWTQPWENEVMKNLTKKFNWGFLDLNPILERFGGDKLVISQKDSHPNEFAHELVATELYNYFQNSSILS